jgi:segregation and condensation protein A
MTTVTTSMSGMDHPEIEPEVAGDGTLQRPYTIHLPGFDGPLDLLLHLIERNQLEITAISLVAVTDQFIAYLKTWDEPPLPRLAEFVAMAARLLLIKSRSLLPRTTRQDEADGEPDPLEDAENLRRHLIEYKIAKEIARALKARELAGLQTFSRPGRLVDAEAMVVLSPPQLVGLNIHALALVFRRVVAEKRLSEPEQIPLPVVTITQKIAEVEAWLREHGKATLEEVLRSADSRFTVVVTFLAVLELWHQSRLIVRQEALFGEIEIVPGSRFGQRIEATSVGGEGPRLEDLAQTPGEPEPESEPVPRRPRRAHAARTDEPE